MIWAGNRLFCCSFYKFSLKFGIFSYVAVVSDNDGSAFITKAEFDSLKNNFQAQIDNYNQSIDSKIDGAIASYLAGIKVNTDETPEFVVYGADGGIWKGKKCNKFYVVTMQSTAWGESSATSKAEFFYLKNSAKWDYGFGWGWYVTDYRYNDARDIKNKGDTVWGLVQQLGSDTPDGSSGGYGNASLYPKMFYRLSTDTSKSSTSTSISISTTDRKNALCSWELSKAFNTLITIWDPQFPLFKFMDNGSISVNFGFVANGYVEEGGYHGGADNAKGPLWGHGDATKLVLMHNGTATTLKTLTQFTDGGWINVSCDVQAGDEIFLSCGGSSSNTDYGITGSYNIFMFENQIPGWKLATT